MSAGALDGIGRRRNTGVTAALDAPEARSRSRYRRDIDGLRAVAVLAVVAFHAAPDLVPGGFAGVDIFFVISGFLITGILLDDARCGELELRTFFARRVRRILPALIAVLAVTMLLGWYLLLTDEFQQLSAHVAAAAGFVVNFVFWREAGYFDTSAELKPLLHLWSLAVEEQFYLVWPLLLAWAMAKRRSIAMLAGVLLAVSFLLNVVLVTRHGPAAFFLLPTRLWELMAGGMLAVYLRNDPSIDPARSSRRSFDALAVVGLALVIAAFVVLSGERHYPGAWALLPVGGTCCLIAAGSQAWLNRMLLARRWLVSIGLISYPLYLWHWPALAFVRIVDGNDADAGHVVAALVASSALAVATFIGIERPIRRRNKAAVSWMLIGVMGVVGVTASAAATGWIRPRMSRAGLARFNDAMKDWHFPGKSFRDWTTPDGLQVTSVGTGKRRIVFFGDSNAQQYGPRMEKLVQSHPELNAQVMFATYGGCPPMRGVLPTLRPECKPFVRKVIAFADSPDVSTVVIAAQWGGYLNHSPFVFDRADGVRLTGHDALEAALQDFGSMIRDLRAKGKQVYVVLNIPAGTELGPRYVLHRRWSGDFVVRSEGLDRQSWERGMVDTVWRLADAAREAGATVIDPASVLCGPTSCPSMAPDGEPMYRDGYHLRASFVREHVRYLDAVVLNPPPQ